MKNRYQFLNLSVRHLGGENVQLVYKLKIMRKGIPWVFEVFQTQTAAFFPELKHQYI